MRGRKRVWSEGRGGWEDELASSCWWLGVSSQTAGRTALISSPAAPAARPGPSVVTARLLDVLAPTDESLPGESEGR